MFMVTVERGGSVLFETILTIITDNTTKPEANMAKAK